VKKLLFLLCIVLFAATNSNAQNALLGMTSQGGGGGNIFKYDLTKDTLVNLYNFTDNFYGGGDPLGSLILGSDGQLYGLTENAGNEDNGTVFKYSFATGACPTLYNIGYSIDGNSPYGDLLQAANGLMYGMDYRGGTSVYGVLFSFNIHTQLYKVLHDFNTGNGAYPYGSLIQATNGKLYGMTEYGGFYYQNGVIFSFDTSSNTYTEVYNFNDTLGANPYGNLLQMPNGMLYGMTSGGGANKHGTIFKFNPVTNKLTDLYAFSIPTGSGPAASLMMASNGLFYGTAASGGAHGYGAIFTFDTNTNTYTDIFDFNDTLGASPYCTLTQATDGMIYGMATNGGSVNYGTFFKINPANNAFTKILDFTGSNGEAPQWTRLLEVCVPAFLTKEPKNAIICPGGDTSFTVLGTAGSPVTYQWQVDTNTNVFTNIVNGSLYSGSTSTTLSVTGAGVKMNGYTYRCVVSNGCVLKSITDTVKLTVDVPKITITSSPANDTVCTGTKATLTATSVPAGGTYTWNNGITNGTAFSLTASGQYIVHAIDKYTCSNYDTVNLVLAPLPVPGITDKSTICRGIPDTVLASGGSSYTWNTGSTKNNIIVTPASTSTYSVVIKSKAGCVKDTSISITILPLPGATIKGVNSICAGTGDTITAGGGISYVWNNGATNSSIIVNPLSTTTYTVNVSSSTCTKDTTFAVTVNSLATLSIIGKNKVCPGLNDTITVSGGTSYTWNTGATTNKIIVAPVSATTYSVTVKKGACILDTGISVSINPIPVISASYNTAICNGSYDTIRVSALNSYKWSNGSTNDSIVINPATTTTYTLVANNGICLKDSSVVLTVNPIPVVTITGDSSICAGSSTKLTAAGAAGYLWFPGAITAASISVSPAASTTYTIIGTTNGCNGTTTRAVNVASSNGFDLAGNLTVCIDTPSVSSASIQACIFNNRCLPVNGTLRLVVDTAFHITSATSDSVAHISGDTLTWNYDSLSDIGKTHCVSLNGTISNIPAGDSVAVSMFITPVTGDSVPANNSVTYWVKPAEYKCQGLPFDPNEKSVIPQGDITAATLLSYTIHFQNTGTAVAKNIVVADTLSPYLDPTTLKVTSASSEVVTTISSGNIVKFTFNGINLPDTTMSKTLSIGIVKYTILPLSSDIAGTQIKNHAGIYFDANAEIITNTTINTIPGAPLFVQNISTALNIAAFPNPFTTTTSIVFNTDGLHYLEVDDVTGRKLESMECTGKQYEFSRKNLADGVYFIKAFDAEHKYVAVQKVVVQ
jgi:uncharacterized repeat protein (TIGR03803 family)